MAGSNPGMVKRKADISLDEWLSKGTLYAEASNAGIVEPVTKIVAEPYSATKGTPVSEEAAASPTTMGDLAEHDAAEWFWDLLAQSG